MSHIPGRDLLRNFESAVADTQRQIDEIGTCVVAEEKRIADANLKREEAYLSLAEHYCDERDQFKRELSSVSREVQEQFDAKAKRRAEVEADIGRCSQLLESAYRELQRAHAQRERAASELEIAQRKVEDELAADLDFQGLKAAAARVETQRERETAASVKLKAEVNAKLAGYEANPWFMYLVRRRFGTPDYKGGGLARRGDGFVSRLVAWERNRVGYEILQELPGYSDRRVADAERQKKAIETRVSLRLQEAENRNGAAEAKLRLDRRCHTVSEMEGRIKELETQRETLRAERQALESNRDPFVRRAKEAIKAVLTRESVRVLRERAQRNGTAKHLECVKRIEAAEAAINAGRLTVKKLREERQALELQSSRIERARQKFSSEYSGPYDRFSPSFDLAALVLGYAWGQTNETAFWNSIHHAHHDATPEPSHDHSSYSSSSSFDSGSSSSSFSSDSGSSSFGGGDSGGGASFGGGDSGGGTSFGGGD